MNQNNSEAILDILQELDEKIILSKRKNVILLLGETGTGKSTLAHIIAKDNTKLKSIRIGTFEFLLVDDDNKISTETTNSKTTIPEVVEDIKNTDLAIYDCPGFNDTRDAKTDISNAYSIHKIMEHSVNFKIVFVINYHSVKIGVCRISFVNMLKNASDYIKNIGNFRGSIAAIITKVDNKTIPNEDGTNHTLILDADILNEIGIFLQDIRKEICTRTSYDKNAITLIDILLIRSGLHYERLAIFRRPNKEGNVNDLIPLQICRSNILKVLNENIIFTGKGENEFGFAISATSKLEIANIVVGINTKIIDTFNNIGQQVIETFKLLESQLANLTEIKEKFNSVHECLNKFNKKLKENVGLTETTDSLIQVLNDLQIEATANIKSIQSFDKQLSFLNKISDRDLNMRSSEWKTGFDNLFDYLNDSKEWYRFLNNLYEKLSTYGVQRDTSKFNIRNLKDLDNPRIREKIYQTGAHIKDMFTNNFNIDDINNHKLLELSDNIENITMDKIKLSHLLRILIYTLETNVRYIHTDPTKIQIIGKYIILSNIPSEILSTDRKNIEFIASEKIFIDQDLNFVGKEKNIIIAANVWEIINTKTINLSGLNGLPLLSPKTASDGEGFGGKGEDGLAGSPGGPAGRFFGVGNKFLNIESLTIIASGGNGGAGQDGGDGTAGIDGDDPILPIIDEITDSDAWGRYNARQELEANNLRYEYIDENISETQIITQYFHVFGSNGGRGGDGGNGGCGGLGGVNGSINITDLKGVIPQRLTSFKYENKIGKTGTNGSGGYGGHGGYNGKRIIAKCEIRVVNKGASTLMGPAFPSPVSIPISWSVTREESANRNNPGLNGLTYTIDNIGESYVPGIFDNFPEIAYQYKKILEDTLNYDIVKSLRDMAN